MYNLKNITPTNGFDFNDLNNARQNNYAWSMAELDDYIYVGTGRNVALTAFQSFASGMNPPSLLEPIPQTNSAEIWRYKKDGSLPWNRVYKAQIGSAIAGFRFMITHRPAASSPCIYASSFGAKVKVLKSTNGIDWFEMNDVTVPLEGTSSRSMVIFNNKLYIATVNDAVSSEETLLYRSKDPEYFPFEKVIDTTVKDFDVNKNPKGSIYNMAVFNNKLYVATTDSDGAQVWRTNSDEPEANGWTLVVDKGFGDSANKVVLSIGVFKEHLYVSGTKSLPLAWVIPLGCDVIRIDKNDNWELVIGGKPLIPSKPSKGSRGQSISGLGSGFNNPFNLYAWQIQEYKGKLLISTFDNSIGMEVILSILLGNRAAIENIITKPVADLIIEAYAAVVKLLAEIKYPIGFDMYESVNGRFFKPVIMRGLNNSNNYGGRILFVDSENKLYIGTANPFQGCEVWKDNNINNIAVNHFSELTGIVETSEEIEGYFKILKDNLPAISEFLPKLIYNDFTK